MKIMVTEWVHGSNENFAEWEMEQDALGNYDRHGDAAAKLHYRLYELEVLMQIDLATGDYVIKQIRIGTQVLT